MRRRRKRPVGTQSARHGRLFFGPVGNFLTGPKKTQRASKRQRPPAGGGRWGRCGTVTDSVGYFLEPSEIFRRAPKKTQRASNRQGLAAEGSGGKGRGHTVSSTPSVIFWIRRKFSDGPKKKPTWSNKKWTGPKNNRRGPKKERTSPAKLEGRSARGRPRSLTRQDPAHVEIRHGQSASSVRHLCRRGLLTKIANANAEPRVTSLL